MHQSIFEMPGERKDIDVRFPEIYRRVEYHGSVFWWGRYLALPPSDRCCSRIQNYAHKTLAFQSVVRPKCAVLKSATGIK